MGHWDWNVEADTLALSSEAAEMLGLPAGASMARLRRDWPRICHPDDLQEMEAVGRQVAEGHSLILTEVRLRRCGEPGDYRRVIIRGRLDPMSRHRFIGELIDVTERRRAEAEAEAAHAMFRRVTEAAPGLLYVLDLRTGASEHLNRGYLAFLPDTGSSETADMLMSLVHPDDLPNLLQHRRACLDLEEGAVAEITLRLRLQDGSQRWIHSQRRAIARGPDGRVTRLVCSAQDVTAIHQSAETLRRLTRRLLTMQDDERRRIARDLHDSTAQNLLGASLAIRSAQRQLEDSPDLEEALKLIDGSQQEIRTLSYLLYPPLLDEMGLSVALAWFADGFSKRTGLSVRLDLPDARAGQGRLPLSREAETAMFRVAQEALANAFRHAGGTGVSLGLGLARAYDGECVARLRIADDGKGMPPQRQRAGLGLVGMGERMRAVGGTLSIESRPGKGTVVEASSRVELASGAPMPG
ncbi:PAS domain-containing protein [Roseococcus pinisoli]|uniref:PAS domain-containing protein n=1 Tax=Roseococcus pinisoli TaxID=2835040 RepID=A0ABS5QDT7_9PROT|nr:PAS domain-containing protein [Roseococcus pinisoli]MBS7811849.1 PAS domain-containing protein [Roseococcus pinisoli]